MFFNCKTVVTISTTVWRCFWWFSIETQKNIETALFLMNFYESVSKRLSFKLFQNYVTASVYKWFGDWFQTRKQQSDVFYFSTDAKTVYNSFFIELFENYVTAYVCNVLLLAVMQNRKKFGFVVFQWIFINQLKIAFHRIVSKLCVCLQIDRLLLLNQQIT